MTIFEQVVTLDRDGSGDRRAALDQVYRQVPNTACACDRLGQCCELTEEEMQGDFAVMFPLYAAEYLNIVAYVEAHFPAEDRGRVLGVVDERPAQCPFLTPSRQCAIHPVRPLTCRTYGVLRRENLLEAAQRHEGQFPAAWINGFLSVESGTVCAGTRVLNPEALAGHADRMIQGVYDRTLTELSRSGEPGDARRQEALREVTGLDRIVRWTWGGFNAAARSAEAWFREHFPEYWRRSGLAG